MKPNLKMINFELVLFFSIGTMMSFFGLLLLRKIKIGLLIRILTMIDLKGIVESLFFTSAKPINEPNFVIYYYLVLYSIVFLIGIYFSIQSYKYFVNSMDLGLLFSALFLLILGFTIISGINILDVIIYYFSDKTLTFIFLIPFLPVAFVLYSSKVIIDQLVHRSKKEKSTFKFITRFIDFSLVVYFLVVVVMLFGFYIDPNSRIPLIIAILGFLINQIVYILIIVFIQKQKSELSSSIGKFRLQNVQIGYIGLFIYFIAIVMVFQITNPTINFLFVNIKVISSFMVIVAYYWSIILPKWLEKRVI